MLETRDLYLKEADVSFAPQLVDYYYRNREFLAPFDPKREDAFYTVESQTAALETDIARREKGMGYRFYIFEKQSGRLIGVIGLNNVIRGSFYSCHIGYKLDEGCINRGYMTQAVQAVVAYGFDELKLHRIEGSALPENVRSLRVMEKCGFAREGYSPKYLKINGVWRDHVHMVILNDNV